MGVGRNLTYKKEEFFNVRGFMDHMKIRSGDDDLFINQAANKKNTAILYTLKFYIFGTKTTFFVLGVPKKKTRYYCEILQRI